MRRDAIAQCLDGKDRLIGTRSRDEEFGLHLGTARRSEVHPEMRQTLIPGPRDSELIGAVLRGVAREWMQLHLLQSRSVKEGRERSGCSICYGLLQPHLGRAMILPICEEADAVPGSTDYIEVSFELVEGKIFVHHL